MSRCILLQRAGFDVGLRDAAHADPRMQLFGLDVL
jgi:hypothetical protein